MADENELNSEFETMLVELECNLLLVNFREKLVASEWIAKLKAANSTKEEMCIRNDFLEFLIKSSAKGQLKNPPFCNIPPANATLLSLARLLPQHMRKRSSNVKGAGDDELIKEMFDESPDKGEFLSQHPVPKNGTFFVIVLKR